MRVLPQTRPGSRFEDLTVEFYVGERVYSGTVLPELSEKLGDNQYKVAVSVPDTVALGSSRVSLTRRQNQVVGQVGTEPVYEEIELSGNSIRLSEGNEYVFAALQRSDQVAVLDGRDPEEIVENSDSANILLSRIPVGTGSQLDRPRDLATTNDGTRVYVVLEGSGQVALVDPLMLRQVDTQALVSGMNPISLPEGAQPKALAIDARDNYAYITDGNRGEIYVLDLNPASDAFHEVVATLSATPELWGGFKQLAISSDGRKLFATGSDNYIYAFNIDPKERPLDPTDQSGKWRQEIGRIQSATGADAIRATADPNKMTFVNGNRNQDGSGFGVIEITNDDPENFAATVTYEDLGIGSFSDYFDVNEGVSVAITRDSSLAFVAGSNSRGNISQSDRRSGGNIGIIKDPLGPDPELIAATRPIPGALTASVELSNDNKYLYASYPTLNGSGNVFVFDIEEMARTLENPGQFQIDHLARGVGSPEFDTSTARSVTAADFETVPIDDINPEISIAADYEILQGDWARQQFTYGVPEDSARGPVGTGRAMGLAASPERWLNLSPAPTDDFTPTFEWDFGEIQPERIDEVNLFVSTFPQGQGLLPEDDFLGDINELGEGNFRQLSPQQKLDLLSKPGNGYNNDFNPNRILTATWERNPSTGVGEWTWGNDTRFSSGGNTSFTLPMELTLTAGQDYYWAVEASTPGGLFDVAAGQLSSPLPPALNGENTFRSVTVMTHGFQFPGTESGLAGSGSNIPKRMYDLAGNIVNAGGIDGLIMRYHRPTGYWVPVNQNGAIVGGLDPNGDNYRANLSAFIAPYLQENKPLVLLNDWAGDRESGIPDSGFSEGAADAFFTSLVWLDQTLMAADSSSKQGALFNSPLHFIGFSRGTPVTSEIVQRMGTHYPEAGGKENSGQRDLQMTTIDPHDFDQPGLSLLGLNSFTDFREPKIQVWDNTTFADNYYQTVPDLDGGSFTPAGRDIPNLPHTEHGKTSAGLDLPRAGWRGPNPNPNAPLLGQPDLSVFLGTNRNEPNYANSRAGFTRETDPIFGTGGTHQRAFSWYAGTTDLGIGQFPNPTAADDSTQPLFQRRGDGYIEELFDKNFSFDSADDAPRVSPWYVPEHSGANFRHADENAPWEGIGTGWFYSALGGGLDLRPQTTVPRVPVDWDNTYDREKRGDKAVPTVFNGNFDASFNLRGLIRKTVSKAVPGWSFHNDSEPLQSDKLVDLSKQNNTSPDLREHLRQVGKDPQSVQNYALKLSGGDEATHNRFVVPDWGTLRFDLHVPNVQRYSPDLDEPRLRVFMTVDEAGGETEHELSARVITRAPSPDGQPTDRGTRQGERLKGVIISFDDRPTDPDHKSNRIAYGSRGFETFHLDVPDQFRGRTATLRFELESESPDVYLDNVFFQSQHLLFGNPTEARIQYDPTLNDSQNSVNNNAIRQNYLSEKPQYAISYNDITKNPNWASWQLNRSWLGTEDRTNLFEQDHTLPPLWQKVQGSGDINGAAGRITDGNRYDRGHMTPSGDRRRNAKENYATFFMSNMLPQNEDNNRNMPLDPGDQPIWWNNTWWRGLEEFSRQLVENDRELYLTAGGMGTRAEILSQESFLINVPDRLWKVVLVLDQPGQSPADVTANTMAFAVDLPNINPANDVDVAPTSWRDYVVPIRELENRLEQRSSHNSYNFLSSLPVEIQDIIETRPLQEIRQWIDSFIP